MSLSRLLLFSLSSALVASCYPISLLITSGVKEGKRWIQNNPAFSLFALTVLPIQIGVFAGGFDTDVISAHANYWWLMVGVLCVAISFAAYMIYEDFTKRRIAPYMIRNKDDREAAFRWEEAARNRALGIATPKTKHLKNPSLDIAKYKALTAAPAHAKQGRQLNSTAYASLVINCLAGAFVATVIWYIVLILFAGHGRPRNLMSINVVLLCATFWLPCRVYSDWYQNLPLGPNEAFKSFRTYAVFWFIPIALLATGFALLIVQNYKFTALSVASLLGVVITLILQIKPKLLKTIVLSYSNLTFPNFVIYSSVVIVLIVGMVVFLLRQSG